MADFAAQVCSDTERWQSGRMHQTRNLAYVHSVPWVQIPPFPPNTTNKPLIFKGFFVFWFLWHAIRYVIRYVIFPESVAPHVPMSMSLLTYPDPFKSVSLLVPIKI